MLTVFNLCTNMCNQQFGQTFYTSYEVPVRESSLTKFVIIFSPLGDGNASLCERSTLELSGFIF